MEPNAKNNKKEWAVGLLIIINLITLAALWLTVFRRPQGGPPPRNANGPLGVQTFLERELGLSREQAKVFVDLRDRFIASAGPIHDEIRRLKESYIAEMFRPRADRTKIEALVAEIGAKRAEEEKRLLFHFLDMVNACGPDQKTKFQTIMREFMTMIGALEPARPPDDRPGSESRSWGGPGGGPRHRGGDAPPPKQR